MAEHFGLAATPWGAIGGGALTGKYLKGGAGRVTEASARRSDRANGIAAKVVEVAGQLGFPHDFLASDNVRELVYGGVYDRIVQQPHP